ncbi:MAG: GNAT family N-acetyltransferase, partial [Anaerolineae bacterium]|nr:GNAT family N-acetyltransferase [Anaerolineae bacterium]
PDHRRRGLARHLMLHTHAALRAAGVEHNTLGVTQGNPARRLYDSLGYAPIGGVWAYVHPPPAEWPG